MSSRTRGKDRCPRCVIWTPLCFCDRIPKVQARTRVRVIMHFREWGMTTNTAKLAKLALPDCEISLRGAPGQPLDLSMLEGDTRTRLLLFPSDDAIELTPENLPRLGPGPFTLIVPDGTWGQASRVRARVPELADVTPVKLPPGPPSEYRLRTAPHPGYVSTFEAIARALGALESDPALRAELESLFRLMVERRLQSKGKLPLPEWVKARL